MKTRCTNCGAEFDALDDAACSFHELADCADNADHTGEALTVTTQNVNGRWHAIVKREARTIYLTDGFACEQTAIGDAQRFIALLEHRQHERAEAERREDLRRSYNE